MIRINLMRGVRIDRRMSWADHERLMRERAYGPAPSPWSEPVPSWVWLTFILLVEWILAGHFSK